MYENNVKEERKDKQGMWYLLLYLVYFRLKNKKHQKKVSSHQKEERKYRRACSAKGWNCWQENSFLAARYELIT